MPVSVNCACGKRLVAPDEAVGHRVRCPHCGAIVPVPAALAGTQEASLPSEASPLEPPVHPTRPFIVEAAYALVYPLKSHGLGVLGAVAAIYAVAALLSTGLLWVLSTLIIKPFLAFYLAAYSLSIVQSSAGGDPDPPNIPDATDLWEDLVQPILLVGAALIASLAPLLIYYLYGHNTQREANVIVVQLLTVWAALYFPMAVMSVAVWRSFAGVSPHVVIPAILRIPVQHLIMAAMVWCVWQGNRAVHRLLEEIFAQSASAATIGGVVLFVLSTYASWAAARIIGITHWTYRKKIGWFRSV